MHRQPAWPQLLLPLSSIQTSNDGCGAERHVLNATPHPNTNTHVVENLSKMLIPSQCMPQDENLLILQPCSFHHPTACAGHRLCAVLSPNLCLMKTCPASNLFSSKDCQHRTYVRHRSLSIPMHQLKNIDASPTGAFVKRDHSKVGQDGNGNILFTTSIFIFVQEKFLARLERWQRVFFFFFVKWLQHIPHRM